MSQARFPVGWGVGVFAVALIALTAWNSNQTNQAKAACAQAIAAEPNMIVKQQLLEKCFGEK